MLYILTTGGTIEGIDADIPNTDSDNTTIAIRNFLEAAGVSFEYTVDEVFRMDSRLITNSERELLANKIEATDSNRILITHGTFTMEDTARYIGNLKLNKTIVLTGSFVLGTSAKTDAPFNLGYAICSLQFLKPDVYVAMNGTIFNWKNVTKNLETNKFEQINE